MAKLKAFSIRDAKAEYFSRPLFAPTSGMAVRSFGDAVADPSHEMNHHPEDYALFEIGEFDEATGVLTGMQPVMIIGALSFVAADPVRPMKAVK